MFVMLFFSFAPKNDEYKLQKGYVEVGLEREREGHIYGQENEN